jgi:hypothetical protein
MCRCTDIMFFPNLSYMASRQLLIPRIVATGTSFSPLPCRAWHGYMVIIAHHMEVEVGADGPASTPLSGAAAAAPPAGACSRVTLVSAENGGERLAKNLSSSGRSSIPPSLPVSPAPMS